MTKDRIVEGDRLRAIIADAVAYLRDLANIDTIILTKTIEAKADALEAEARGHD